MDGFPSGQRGQTVNLLQIASVVRIHHHPVMMAGQISASIIARGGAVWKLAGLITRRSQVQILSPQLHIAPGQRPDPERFLYFLCPVSSVGRAGD